MEQFILMRGESGLKPFPHIAMLGARQSKRIEPGSLSPHVNPGIEICCVLKGEFAWDLGGMHCRLRPGDASMTCPWQIHGGLEGHLNLGTLAWIIISPERFTTAGNLRLGKWSMLEKSDEAWLGKLLSRHGSATLRGAPEIQRLLAEITGEVIHRSQGYTSRVNYLVSDLLLMFGRRLEESHAESDGAPSTVDRALQALARDPGHAWTVGEMADLCSMKRTAFTARMRRWSGYAPHEYLVKLRVDRARGLLLDKTERPITAIALDLGFYSSQHFSRLFRKYAGTTPRSYRGRRSRR